MNYSKVPTPLIYLAYWLASPIIHTRAHNARRSCRWPDLCEEHSYRSSMRGLRRDQSARRRRRWS